MTEDTLIADAWDTHVHAGPDVTDRKHGMTELAIRAAEAGMEGLVIKNHHFPTAMAAALVESEIDLPIELESTIVLNRTVGGINIDAVKAAAKMGATRMEFPTTTAERNMLDQGEPRTITIIDENGDLTDIVRSVLDNALKQEMVIGTGHVSVDEVKALVDAVVESGGEVIVTHPELHAARNGIGLTPDMQAELARPGVYFERCYVVADESIREFFPTDATEDAHEAFRDGAMFDEIVAGIKATGAEHNLLSTDYGQPERHSPPAALAKFHAELEEAGIDRREIESMARENPRELFGRR